MTARNLTLAGVLGLVATVIGIWTSVGLPGLAWSTDIEALTERDAKLEERDARLEKVILGNSALIMQGERNRISRDILDIDQEIEADPANRALRKHRLELEQTRDGIQREIDQLAR